MDYQKQAKDFLEQTGTKLTWTYIKHDVYFIGDSNARDIYKFTLRRNGKQYTGTFGQSLSHHGQEPTAYDLLSCLTKYDPGTFENFCAEFGYNTDSIRDEKTYKAVVKEWAGVNRLYGHLELENLQEIQ